MYEIKITEITETTKETRKKMEKMTDKELIKKICDVIASIEAGFPHAIYYQEFSIGLETLRKRGFKVNSPKEVKKLKNI